MLAEIRILTTISSPVPPPLDPAQYHSPLVHHFCTTYDFPAMAANNPHPMLAAAQAAQQAARDAENDERLAAEAHYQNLYNALLVTVRVPFYYPRCLDDTSSHEAAAKMCILGYLTVTRAGAGSIQRSQFWSYFFENREISDNYHLCKKLKAFGNEFARTTRTRIVHNMRIVIANYICEYHLATFLPLAKTEAYFVPPAEGTEFNDNDSESVYLDFLIRNDVLREIYAPLEKFFRPEIWHKFDLPILRGLGTTLLFVQRVIFEHIVKTATKSFTKFEDLPFEVLESVKRMNAHTEPHAMDLNAVTANTVNQTGPGQGRATGDNIMGKIPAIEKHRLERRNPRLPGLNNLPGLPLRNIAPQP